MAGAVAASIQLGQVVGKAKPITERTLNQTLVDVSVLWAFHVSVRTILKKILATSNYV